MEKTMILGNTLMALLLIAPLSMAQDELGNETEDNGAHAKPNGKDKASESSKSASADMDTTPAEDDDSVSNDAGGEVSRVGIDAAIKAGATFHTIFNELSPMLLLELEAGVFLLERHLEIDVALAWAQPKATLSEDDPRLVDGGYEWEIKQDFLSLGLMVRYRIFDASSLFNLYGAAGPRMLMLRTIATGKSGGEQFGENKQFETRFGGYGAIGGEFNLGPGAILLEVGMTFGDLDGYITGDTSSAALDTYLGYRFMFDL